MIDTTVLKTDLDKVDNRLNIFPFEPRLYINRGMLYFKLTRLIESLKDFNKAEELNPQLTPYLWQRGLTYYYLQKYAKAARQFELDLSVHSLDIEETIWFFLCIAQLEDAISARECLLPVKKDDPRPYMRQIYQVFAGKYSVDVLTNLNSNCDLKHLFYGSFYAALYYEAHKNYQMSASLMAKAISYKINDYMWYVACTHQHLQNISNAQKAN